jgi:polysaccharide export outer membrane protein
MVRKLHVIVFIFIYFAFSGCKTREKIVYLQDNTKFGSSQNVAFDPTIKVDDFVTIKVLGIDPEAVVPFNIPITSTTLAGGYVQGAPTPPGYVVDFEGNIDFPVVGKIKISGLKRSEATQLLKSKLEPYVQNPTILFKILNYKITVLGDVRNPGTFTIPNEKVTIFEAIGIAGDLLITGKRNNVKVIRESDTGRKEFIVDLTSSDVFNSPVFYLQQNDLVYVEPNRSKINSSIINTSNVSLVLSSVSVLLTIIFLFNN